MLILINKPVAERAVHNEDPPYDRKRSGMPVMGMIPMTIPTLTVK
jgi:hypothetical protein